MAYGSLLTDTVQSSTTGTPPQFNDGSGTQVGTLCRAWVSFTGSTGAKLASFNVSSITRASAGVYTVTFTNAMPDTNYSATGACAQGSGNAMFFSGDVSQTVSTTQYQFQLRNYLASNLDATYVYAQFFR